MEGGVFAGGGAIVVAEAVDTAGEETGADVGAEAGVVCFVGKTLARMVERSPIILRIRLV